MLKIGISACFFHEDPKRAIFKGMTLQYIEQNVAHWLMQRDVLAFMVPSPEGRTRRAGSQATVDAYARGARRPGADGRLRRLPRVLRRDGAAARVERRPHPRRLRDRAAAARSWRRSKPVLGVCRGAQVINVAQGGTLYQDLGTQAAARAQPPQLGDLRARTATRRRSCPARGLARALSGHAARQDQLDPPPGGEGPRPRPRRRGVVGARPRRRGDALHRAGLRVRRAVASRVPRARRSVRSSTTRRSSTTFSPPPRGTRPRRTPSEPGTPDEDHQSRHRCRHRRRRRRQRRGGAPQVRGRPRGPGPLGEGPDPEAARRDRRSSASGSSPCRRRSRAR